MATLEQGDTPSCSISGGDERLLQELGLQNNGVSPLFTRGLKAIKKKRRVKDVFEDFQRGDASMQQLIKALNDL